MLCRLASMSARRRFVQKRPWFAYPLIVALLVVQAAGLSHMIRHGTPVRSVDASHNEAQASWSSGAIGTEHSCVLFGADSLGAGLTSVSLGSTCDDAARHALVSAVIEDEPDLPALVRFLSRAPPSMDIAA